MAYLVTFFLSILFCILSEFFFEKKKILGLFFLAIAIIIPSVLAGCRDLSIGTDTGFYVLDYFRDAKFSRNYQRYNELIRTEIGYAIFNFIITKFFGDIMWLLFFIQAFILSSISLAVCNLKKYKILPWVFLVYFLLYYSNSLNMTRQSMAISLCIYSFSFILRRKIVWALVVAGIAVLFHLTAFIFFIVFVIYWYTSKFEKNFWLFQVLISIICITIVLMLDTIIISFIGIGVVPEGFATYTKGGIYGSNLPLSDLFLCTVYFCVFMILRKFLIIDNREKNFFQTIFLVSVILCFAAIQSTFAVRGMYYFSYLAIIIIPILTSSIEEKRVKYLFWASITILFILYWVLTIPIANLGETFPYKSRILNL